MSDVIYLSNVRLSFPHLIEPQKSQFPDPVTGAYKLSYNCEVIMPENHAGHVQFQAQIVAMANTKWADKAAGILKMIMLDRKSRCFGDGNTKVSAKTLKLYDGYENNVYVTAGRESKPQVFQANGKPVAEEDSMAYQQVTRKMYGGCRVNVAVKPWLQDNKFGRAIRCDLVAIQFAGDDTAFGDGKTDASALFAAIAAPAVAAPAVDEFAEE
jgi:hypothetical protein